MTLAQHDMTKHCSKKSHSWTKRKWFRIIQIQEAFIAFRAVMT